MSAYVVEREHIQYLVWAADYLASALRGLSWYHGGEHHQIYAGDHAKLAEIGRMLWAENEASVAYRYDEQAVGEADTFTEADILGWGHTWSVPQVIKSIDCLEYQSCEHPGWEGSEARAFLMALKDSAICTLPGYEEAVWGAPKLVDVERDRRLRKAEIYAQLVANRGASAG